MHILLAVACLLQVLYLTSKYNLGEAIMYCFKCGAKVPDGAKFCSSCGAQLIDDPSAKEPTMLIFPYHFRLLHDGQ